MEDAFRGRLYYFGDEELTGDELLERLEGAKEVVKSLNAQIETQGARIANQADLIRWRNERIEYLQSVGRGLALDLARAGGYDHKGKNERILEVVTTLLEIAIPRTMGRYFSGGLNDDDTIPF